MVERATGSMAGLKALRSAGFRGVVAAPGDKSISHRALIFGALSTGDCLISRMLEGDDVLRTAAAMRALGVDVERDGHHWRVRGTSWRSPQHALYFGNSGTGARLVMGAAAGQGVSVTLDGDLSLRARPMGRVLEPLRMMGVEAETINGKLPVSIEASSGLSAVNVKLAKPSAQVKSAILLAALGASGVTRIHEPILCRDHTERMLKAFGVSLDIESDGEYGRYISIAGGQVLHPCDIVVPGDPSSAAFLIAAAVITPNSEIEVQNVLMNPTRIGFIETLREMGADIAVKNARETGGEPVADIVARTSILHGVSVPPNRAPSMIDEYPILAVVAAFANGETMMSGIEELRVKESDRIKSMETGLVACGVDVESGPDWMRVTGAGSPPAGGGRIATHHDHRIAMSFLILGGASEKAVEIDDRLMIATSYPDFVTTMNKIGGRLDEI